MSKFFSALWAVATALAVPAEVAPAADRVDERAFLDNCTTVPGYAAFRTEFERVVIARDGDGLRALFHPEGVMRVHGIGGRGDTPDWGFGRPQAEAVWKELDQILPLGCATSEERLVLPALFVYAETEELVLLRAETLRLAPQADAKAVRRVQRGQYASFTVYDTPSGWTEVTVDGATGYVPTTSLRSPFSFRLELVPVDGGWLIREFSDGV